MIGPLGRITEALALGQAGFIDAELPRPHAPTVYSRIGDSPVFLALLVLFALLCRHARRVNDQFPIDPVKR